MFTKTSISAVMKNMLNFLSLFIFLCQQKHAISPEIANGTV